MKYAKWLFATAIGAGLTLSATGGLAQLRVEKNADAPRTKALGVDGTLQPEVSPITGADEKAAIDRRKARRAAATTPAASSAVTTSASAQLAFRSSMLIGTPIMDSTGSSVGKVVDLVTDQRGNLLYPLISYSGFNDKLFAIPSSGLSLQTGANNATIARLTFDPTALKTAPSFSSAQFPDFTDPSFLTSFRSFWSNILPPASAGALARATAADRTVPGNGPGDRPATQQEANTPTLPVDPTLPANGPGDRPARTNPAIPQSGASDLATAGSPGVGAATTGTAVPAGTGTGAFIPVTPGSAGFATPGTSTTTSGSATASGSTTTTPGSVTVGPSSKAKDDASVTTSGTTALRVSPDGGLSSTTSANAGSNLMLRSSQIVGLPIEDKQGEVIGKVVDVVGNTRGNNMFAAISLNGSGFDDRVVVVPYHALHFQAGAAGQNFTTLTIPPGQLAKAPSFNPNEWPNFSSPQFMNNFQKFFQPLAPEAMSRFNANANASLTPTGPTTPGGSTPLPGGGVMTPPWPSRPIPPGGPVPRPGPGGNFPTTTTPPTGGTPATPFPLPPLPRTTTPGTTVPGSPTTGAPGRTPGIPVPGSPGTNGGRTPGIPVPGTGTPGGPGIRAGGGGGAKASGS